MANHDIEWQNDWARWRARDENGDLYEYDLKPQLGVVNWKPAGGSIHFECVSRGPHWRDTLEARPVESGEPEFDADGWTPWPGGGIPVGGDTLVDVRFRDGSLDYGRPAHRFWWKHNQEEDDIVEYRLAQPAPETQSEPDADSHDGTLTGAALYRAIADAIGAGEGPVAFQVDRTGDGFVTAWSWAQLVVDDDLDHPIRRKPVMRSATLPSGETVEWPAPMTAEPADGTDFWLAFDDYRLSHQPYIWDGQSGGKAKWLAQGRCHATREARDQAERAFVAISRGTTDAD